VSQRSVGGANARLLSRLQTRLPEIEEACLREAYAIADPSAAVDLSYREGLQAAISAALKYALAATIAPPNVPEAPVPDPVLTQARNAARAQIGLDTVIRRCFAGDALLRDCLTEEAENIRLDRSALTHLRRSQKRAFDQLLEAVGLEYRRAVELPVDPAARLTKRLHRLLAGEAVEITEIPYDFDAHHIALIVSGRVKDGAIRNLAQALNRQVLLTPASSGELWVWLGGRKALNASRVRRVAAARTWPTDVSVGIGESSYGLPGWQRTHRQAQSASEIAKRSSPSVRRYADVAILAALLRDDLLVSSLNELYLAPLESQRDRGGILQDTLRAYFSAQRNVSSAAEALGVKRHTVTNRLRAIEEIIGETLTDCATTLDLVLSLEELSSTPVELQHHQNLRPR
jgi:DNA-binding PucR family transcriptional regulator